MVYDKGWWEDGMGPPPGACLPFNRCNLPARVLGSPLYQEHPLPLDVANVRELHRDLFQRLDRLEGTEQRVEQFMDYMVVRFVLQAPEEAGYTPGHRFQRRKMDYLRILRGWLFDSDGREAAVLKGWAASRFGLAPRWHGGPILDPEDASHDRLLAMQSAGIYNTNALEAQLDLVFMFCQYELARRHPGESHRSLFRGINRLREHEIMRVEGRGEKLLWLNNLNSFTDDRDRAGEFGDYVLAARLPLAKIVCFNQLFPGYLKGENEFLVLGGACRGRVGVYP